MEDTEKALVAIHVVACSKEEEEKTHVGPEFRATSKKITASAEGGAIVRPYLLYHYFVGPTTATTAIVAASSFRFFVPACKSVVRIELPATMRAVVPFPLTAIITK